MSRYWEIQCRIAENTYKEAQRRLEENPDNPWCKTRLEFAQERYAECVNKLKEVQA